MNRIQRLRQQNLKRIKELQAMPNLDELTTKDVAKMYGVSVTKARRLLKNAKRTRGLK